MPRKPAVASSSFEDSLKKLEAIVKRLEEEELPLDAALKLFAEGQTVSKACETQLRAAENQVRQLLEAPDGSIREVPLDLEDEEDDSADADEEAPGVDDLEIDIEEVPPSTHSETDKTPPSSAKNKDDIPF